MLVLPEAASQGLSAFPIKWPCCAYEVEPLSAIRLETKKQPESRRPYDRIFRRPLADGIIAKHIPFQLADGLWVHWSLTQKQEARHCIEPLVIGSCGLGFR